MTIVKKPPDSPLIRLGISACLLGEKVRFDGGHKLDTYIRDTLGQYFEFVPVCPEVAIGLGVPRPTLHLVGDPAQPRAVGVRDPSHDVTVPLRQYGRRMVAELPPLAGFLLKSRSPSCGMARVKVYQDQGVPAAHISHHPTAAAADPLAVTGRTPSSRFDVVPATPASSSGPYTPSQRRLDTLASRGGEKGGLGRGLFADELLRGRPLLPVEEEGRLGDPVLRENFIERVFAFHRWQQLEAQGLTPARLVEFHARHKLVLMSHGTEAYRALGRLVARAGSEPLAALAQDYIAGFMAALTRPATRKRHANVLQHLMGYLKKPLDGADKAELLELIDAYRLGQVPLIVPVTLLNHHFRRHPHPYVAEQVYLAPHPRELMLRNHI